MIIGDLKRKDKAPSRQFMMINNQQTIASYNVKQNYERKTNSTIELK